MRYLRVAVLVVLVVGAALVVSGMRHVPATIFAISPPICGPLTDGNGNPAGDAGPCPSMAPVPTPIQEHWEWAPFWASDQGPA